MVLRRIVKANCIFRITIKPYNRITAKPYNLTTETLHHPFIVLVNLKLQHQLRDYLRCGVEFVPPFFFAF